MGECTAHYPSHASFTHAHQSHVCSTGDLSSLRSHATHAEMDFLSCWLLRDWFDAEMPNRFSVTADYLGVLDRQWIQQFARQHDRDKQRQQASHF